jgi:hypothetical protein
MVARPISLSRSHRTTFFEDVTFLCHEFTVSNAEGFDVAHFDDAC